MSERRGNGSPGLRVCVWRGRGRKHRTWKKVPPEFPLGIVYKFSLSFLYGILYGQNITSKKGIIKYTYIPSGSYVQIMRLDKGEEKNVRIQIFMVIDRRVINFRRPNY